MKATIEQNIEILKEKVEFNNYLINKNREILRDVIKQPVSKIRTQLFIEHFQTNLELFSKNHLFLKLQHELNRSVNITNGLKTFGMMSLS
jgi:hypothetical protein